MDAFVYLFGTWDQHGLVAHLVSTKCGLATFFAQKVTRFEKLALILRCLESGLEGDRSGAGLIRSVWA